MLVARRDTIFLTREQVDTIRAIEVTHRARLEALWTPVARYLEEAPDPIDERAAMARVQRTEEVQAGYLKDYIERIKAVLTPYQLNLLPRHIKLFLDPNSIAYE